MCYRNKCIFFKKKNRYLSFKIITAYFSAISVLQDKQGIDRIL